MTRGDFALEQGDIAGVLAGRAVGEGLRESIPDADLLINGAVLNFANGQVHEDLDGDLNLPGC